MIHIHTDTYVQAVFSLLYYNSNILNLLHSQTILEILCCVWEQVWRLSPCHLTVLGKADIRWRLVWVVLREGGREAVQSLGATNGVGESLDHCRGVWEHLKPASPEAHKDCFNERDENRAKGQRGEKRDMAFNIHNQAEQTRTHTNPVCVIYMDIETWEQTKNKVLKCVASFFCKSGMLDPRNTGSCEVCMSCRLEWVGRGVKWHTVLSPVCSTCWILDGVLMYHIKTFCSRLFWL